MLVILAVLSMALGNITAIAQTNLKRMLAYSTIAHMGFMLLGLLSGVVGGNAERGRRLQRGDVLHHRLRADDARLLRHAAVPVARGLRVREPRRPARASTGAIPWYAFIMLLLMFSLAGVPPTVGFYAKLAVLSAAVNAGPDLAGGGRGGALADRRVLLPAHREAHVLRRADGRARRSPAGAGRARAALGQRPRAARPRPPAAAADGALRRRRSSALSERSA